MKALCASFHKKSACFFTTYIGYIDNNYLFLNINFNYLGLYLVLFNFGAYEIIVDNFLSFCWHIKCINIFNFIGDMDGNIIRRRTRY